MGEKEQEFGAPRKGYRPNDFLKKRNERQGRAVAWMVGLGLVLVYNKDVLVRKWGLPSTNRHFSYFTLRFRAKKRENKEKESRNFVIKRL